MQIKLVSIIAIISVMILFAVPASANHFQNADLIGDCESYTITVTGSVFRALTVDYSLTLTSSSGDEIVVTGSTEIPYPPKEFSIIITDSWNVDLCGTYTVTGTVALISYDLDPVTTWESRDLGPISVECECDEGPGTGTPGYWKNHPGEWPLEEITIGDETYSKGEAINILKTPETGDKSYTIFRALVAAILNVANGTDSSCIEETIAAADEWMSTYGPAGSGVKASSPAWSEGEPLYETLDDYNNGLLCAPPRD